MRLFHQIDLSDAFVSEFVQAAWACLTLFAIPFRSVLPPQKIVRLVCTMRLEKAIVSPARLVDTRIKWGRILAPDAQMGNTTLWAAQHRARSVQPGKVDPLTTQQCQHHALIAQLVGTVILGTSVAKIHHWVSSEELVPARPQCALLGGTATSISMVRS